MQGLIISKSRENDLQNKLDNNLQALAYLLYEARVVQVRWGKFFECHTYF